MCARVPNEHFGAADENTSFLYTNILVKYNIEIHTDINKKGVNYIVIRVILWL